jgi:GNAT superfamily N-acetyltransferase
MVYSPTLTLDSAGNTSVFDDVSLDVAREEDLGAIAEIAGRAFSTSRFLLDWRLDRELSNLRYQKWVESSFANPDHTMLAARIGGDFVAFFVIEGKSNRECYWHLTAVAPKFQGRGIGRRVWRAMISRNRLEGFDRITTTISAHNAPVLNLYARTGFRFDAPRATFHWLR